jgi:hypothetical protein
VRAGYLWHDKGISSPDDEDSANTVWNRLRNGRKLILNLRSSKTSSARIEKHEITFGGLAPCFPARWGVERNVAAWRTHARYRRHHDNQITFSAMYAFSEKFVLLLSHDEVIYGKHSLLAKMSSDEWQQFANLCLLFAYQFGFAGKNLLFLGGDFAQRNVRSHDTSLDWHLSSTRFIPSALGARSQNVLSRRGAPLRSRFRTLRL